MFFDVFLVLAFITFLTLHRKERIRFTGEVHLTPSNNEDDVVFVDLPGSVQVCLVDPYAYQRLTGSNPKPTRLQKLSSQIARVPLLKKLLGWIFLNDCVSPQAEAEVLTKPWPQSVVLTTVALRENFQGKPVLESWISPNSPKGGVEVLSRPNCYGMMAIFYFGACMVALMYGQMGAAVLSVVLLIVSSLIMAPRLEESWKLRQPVPAPAGS